MPNCWHPVDGRFGPVLNSVGARAHFYGGCRGTEKQIFFSMVLYSHRTCFTIGAWLLSKIAPDISDVWWPQMLSGFVLKATIVPRFTAVIFCFTADDLVLKHTARSFGLHIELERSII